MANEFGKLSSTFYKLEKPLGAGFGYLVYEFHTTANGNRYFTSLEEKDDHTWKTNINEVKLPQGELGAELGNEKYKLLKAEGFEFKGIWEMDIYGNKRKR